jgi:ABC-2 type transport system ATP-binding protein
MRGCYKPTWFVEHDVDRVTAIQWLAIDFDSALLGGRGFWIADDQSIDANTTGHYPFNCRCPRAQPLLGQCSRKPDATPLARCWSHILHAPECRSFSVRYKLNEVDKWRWKLAHTAVVFATVHSMTAIIQVRDLIFEYPGRRALDRVTFDIEAGAVTALVGPNGAGKTTLMRCLCGLERPLVGEIRVDAIDVIEEPRRCHERIGFLPDFVGLYEALTVEQCLHYHAAANGVTSGLALRLRETAAQLGLTDRLQQRVSELSRGLRQRVAVGQAIIHQPALLILDEPASGLDPEARHDLASLFRTLQGSGMSLLVSSHILAELEDYATHMLVLKDGRLIEHRALRGSPVRAELLIEVLSDAARARAWLAARAEVSDVEMIPSGARVVCAGLSDAHAVLLRDMVTAGFAVSSFAPVGSDLQRSYLDSVRTPPESRV